MTDTPHDYPHRAEANGSGPGADVLPLHPGRNLPIDADGATGPAPTTTPPEASPGGGPDRPASGPGETTDVHPDRAPDGPASPGESVRVDGPDDAPADWLASLAAKRRERRPIVPSWLRSRREAGQTAAWVGQHAAYVALYQMTRSPKYAAKLAARAPRGLFRLVKGLVWWTFDLEGEAVRMATVRKEDPEAYLKLSRQRDARVRIRVPVAIVAAIATVAAGWWWWRLATAAPVEAPGWCNAHGGCVPVMAGPPWSSTLLVWGIVAALVAVLGIIGRPADRPLIDRAVVAAKVEKLTSDVVVRALGSIGIAAVNQAIAKNPKGAIEFRAPIMRDGPGWLAMLDLPYGVTVAQVMDKRRELASGLRRSLGCVWPEPVPDTHPGRLGLWVGDQDMNKARQPAWPLTRSGWVDLFKPVAFGTDQRGRTVKVTLMFVSVVIGSIPRMGKTFLLRLLAVIAALDPRAELHLYDLKGTGDLDALEGAAHRHRAGEDDEDIEYALDGMRALKAELRRRAKVIRSLPKDVCPESKVTSELASKKSLGLHPIVICVDECQVWFEHPKHGAEFEDICTDLVKRGPATGIVPILATQRPDSKSLPTGISANAVLRMCLKVMGQVENDMVLGTSSYRNGVKATMFSFGDKGIFYFAGEGEAARIVRGVYLDAPAAEKIASRARAARERAGTLTGHAAGEGFDTDTAPAFDLLKDIAAVVPAGEAKVWNETVVDRLAALRPDAYGQWAALEAGAKTAQLTNALKPYGVRTGQVWGTAPDGRGANRIGITRDDITTAITERDGKRER